jgi:hypothetical protein
MKLKTSFLIIFALTSPIHLSAHAAYYVAPLCIGVSFAGAFSWSVFRQPNREPITRESVNPVVLTPTQKTTDRVYDTLEKAVIAHKAREALNLTLPLSKTDDLAVTREMPAPSKEPVWLMVPGYKGQRPQKYKKVDTLNKKASTNTTLPHRDSTRNTTDKIDTTKTVALKTESTHDDMQQVGTTHNPLDKNDANQTVILPEIPSSLDSSLHEASTLVCAANIPSTCVTFEFDDDRRSFNFGQRGDLTRLSLIYEELAQTHELVLFGSCRGGTTLLNLLSNPDTPFKSSIKALVLESPSLSLAKLSEQVGKNYLGWMPGSGSLIHTFFKTWFPSYDAHFPSCLNQLANIPQELPILIGHVENDKVIAWSEIHDLVKGLIKSGHNHVYLARIVDPAITHARLNSNEQFRNVLNAFLAHYNLPHDAQKARAGVELLESARQEALRVAQEK